MCSIFIGFVVLQCFCDYGGLYCCEDGVHVLFCIGVWACADVGRTVTCVPLFILLFHKNMWFHFLKGFTVNFI